MKNGRIYGALPPHYVSLPPGQKITCGALNVRGSELHPYKLHFAQMIFNPRYLAFEAYRRKMEVPTNRRAVVFRAR